MRPTVAMPKGNNRIVRFWDAAAREQGLPFSSGRPEPLNLKTMLDRAPSSPRPTVALFQKDSSMTEIRHHTVHANGIRQHFLEAGKGAAVVLLHGFPETSFGWRFQIPELAKHYRVIAPDLRGYGETEKPSSGYDKRNMAKDLRVLMTTLGIEKIALVGHDRGARRYPFCQRPP